MNAVQGLNYHVPSNQNKKERVSLLKGLNGYINPNELTALRYVLLNIQRAYSTKLSFPFLRQIINLSRSVPVLPQMGPSGSGKTTLLDVLAGRKNAGVLEGTVLFGSQVCPLTDRLPVLSRHWPRPSCSNPSNDHVDKALDVPAIIKVEQKWQPWQLCVVLHCHQLKGPPHLTHLPLFHLHPSETEHSIPAAVYRSVFTSCAKAGYVEQFDTLIGMLTVKEMVSAALFGTSRGISTSS
eukprot:1142940-Pelagomonas_calceolata.AAC.3